MPDSGIADGATFSSAFWDSYVREQVCATCTSSTRPTNVEGRLIYETNTDRLLMGTGSGSNWICLAEPSQSWTPTVSGLTVGNGTWTAAYRRHDGWCTARGSFVLGSTSAITGSLLVTLPYTPVAASAFLTFCQLYDSSAGTVYHGVAGAYTSPQMILNCTTASGTYTTRTAISSTVPFTWATSDQIEFAVTFQMANRYD